MPPITDHAPEITVAPASPFQLELARIRAAYERRRREVPPNLYSDTNPHGAVYQRELEQRILELVSLKIAGTLATQSILDVGCGEGRWLRRFIQWGASPENVAGIDLLPERVVVARDACLPAVRVLCGSADQTSFVDGGFDIVLCMNVLSSILSGDLRAAIATEMLRVLRPGGFVLWYDFFVNNPANPDVRGVRRLEIAGLFPGCDIELGRITVAAPLGRAIARVPYTYAALAKCRIFCTHYLGWIRKR